MYTSHGYMTGADFAEVCEDYDLNLCGCCESDTFEQDEEEEDGRCVCGHEH